jgi:uncharacterized membrane protein (DUF106 family)
MEKLVKRLEDGTLAFGACFLSSNAASAQAAVDVNSVPAEHPMLTQVIVPVLTGIILPFLKEIIMDARKRRKERKAIKHGHKDAVSDSSK